LILLVKASFVRGNTNLLFFKKNKIEKQLEINGEVRNRIIMSLLNLSNYDNRMNNEYGNESNY